MVVTDAASAAALHREGAMLLDADTGTLRCGDDTNSIVEWLSAARVVIVHGAPCRADELTRLLEAWGVAAWTATSDPTQVVA